MTERLPSDHDTVSTVRAHLEPVGRTSRLRVPLPQTLDVAIGDVIRLSLAGEATHAQVSESLSGDPDIRGAFENRRLARTASAGTDHLQSWFDEGDLSAGDPLLIDVITPGFQYGFRRPGKRVIYEARDPPDSSLVDIARNLEE